MVMVCSSHENSVYANKMLQTLAEIVFKFIAIGLVGNHIGYEVESAEYISGRSEFSADSLVDTVQTIEL